MSAAVRAQGRELFPCKLSGCSQPRKPQGPRGRPFDYCVEHDSPKHPDRTSERTARSRAVAHNTLTRVEGELNAPAKRTTSMPREDSDRDEDWAYGAGAGAWDDTSLAWQHGRLATVDRLMAVSERSLGSSRPLANRHYGESSSPVPVRSHWHVSSARRLPPDFGDRKSPGELWLRGQHQAAQERAEKNAKYARHLAERSGNGAA